MGRRLFAFVTLTVTTLAGAGCRQKMAEQPYYRPYEPSGFFDYKDELGQIRPGSSSRPLERGVIHRAQYLDNDPLVTGLTRDEWTRAYSRQATPKVDAGMNADQLQEANRNVAIGSPRYAPVGFAGQGTPAPKDFAGGIYVTEFPFEITPADLKRGQERYTVYCAVCHGPYGNGQGKIWERGYLTPTSFHTEKVAEEEVTVENPPDIPLGYSRGYGLWGIKIPMREVPVGYYFEVITRGYGGMPSYSAQIPPADRWRIIAYVRALQVTQHPAMLPPEAKPDAGGKK